MNTEQVQAAPASDDQSIVDAVGTRRMNGSAEAGGGSPSGEPSADPDAGPDVGLDIAASARSKSPARHPRGRPTHWEPMSDNAEPPVASPPAAITPEPASPETESGTQDEVTDVDRLDIEPASAAPVNPQDDAWARLHDPRNVAHDLNRPIADIRAMAEAAAALEPNDAVGSLLRRIVDQADSALDLVHSVVDGIDHGPRWDRVDLRQLVDDFVAGLPARAARRVNVHADRCVLPGDEMACRRMIDNLLLHALRESSGPIDVWIVPDADEVLVLVSDRRSGPGNHAIPDPRTSSGTSLAIAATVAALHGGGLGSYPREHGGTTLRANLPRMRPTGVTS